MTDQGRGVQLGGWGGRQGLMMTGGGGDGGDNLNG